MKRLFVATIVAVVVGGGIVDAGQSGKQRKPNDDKHAVAHGDKPEDRSQVAVHVAFGTREVALIRTHYAPRYRKLPPGLQKKIARGGQLPPGWRKKFEPFPVVLERQLPPLPPSYRRGVIDGHAVIYSPGTQMIIDVAVLF